MYSAKSTLCGRALYKSVIIIIIMCVALELWPDGKYALPRPVYDCPSQSLHKWTTGMAMIKLRPLPFNMPASSWSGNLHHLGTNKPNEFIITACATDHDESTTLAVTEDNRQPWPEGSYCIYKTGGDCPNGLCIILNVFVHSEMY